MLQWFMQDPKASQTRKPWYQRAMQMATIWRPTMKPARVPPSDNNPTWKALAKPAGTEIHSLNGTSNSSRRPQKLRKCSSLRVASSFTRVCLCAPISSYKEVFRAEYVPPRRSYSYPGGSKPTPGPAHQERGPASPRPSIELCRRVIFRGKSLRDDVFMRRFVVEEEEAMLQVRRRNQMEAIRRRSLVRRSNKLGPSPLSRMVRADDDDIEEEEEEK